MINSSIFPSRTISRRLLLRKEQILIRYSIRVTFYEEDKRVFDTSSASVDSIRHLKNQAIFSATTKVKRNLMKTNKINKIWETRFPRTHIEKISKYMKVLQNHYSKIIKIKRLKRIAISCKILNQLGSQKEITWFQICCRTKSRWRATWPIKIWILRKDFRSQLYLIICRKQYFWSSK